MKSQFAISSWGGRRKCPFAFTEHGVLMLTSVLNSDLAIKVNIQIMRVYSKLRSMLSTHKELLLKFDQLEMKLAKHDSSIMIILDYIKKFEKTRQLEIKQKNRHKIGY